MTVDQAEHAFWLDDGGPFHAFARRINFLKPNGAIHAGWLAAIAWVPLVIASVIRVLAGYSVDPLMHDVSVHTRLLVAVPTLIGAGRILDQTARAAFHQLYENRMVEPAALNALADRALALRDHVVIEALIAAAAIAWGQVVLWGGETGLIHGGEAMLWSFGRLWYGFVALPLVLFLMVRWMWRWAVWTYVLVRLSRLPIATIGTHPDHAAGLEPVSWPLTAFSGFLFALSSILAGAWGTQLIDGRMTVPTLFPTLCVFVVLAYVVGCAPLLLFTGKLYRAHRRALADYTPLAHDYVRKLQEKWIDGHPSEPLLGSPDFQSWHDLESAFENLARVRLFAFGLGSLRNMLIATLVPALPLLATTVSVNDVFRRLSRLLLGGA